MDLALVGGNGMDEGEVPFGIENVEMKRGSEDWPGTSAVPTRKWPSGLSVSVSRRTLRNRGLVSELELLGEYGRMHALPR